MMSTEAREAQARYDFLYCIKRSIAAAARAEGSDLDKLNLLAHSMLVLIDGCGDLPPIDLVLRPGEPDEDAMPPRYEDGDTLNRGVYLHDLLFKI